MKFATKIVVAALFALSATSAFASEENTLNERNSYVAHRAQAVRAHRGVEAFAPVPAALSTVDFGIGSQH